MKSIKNFEVVLYQEDDNTYESIEKTLKLFKTFKDYAFILHDKEESKNHFHIYVRTNGITFDRIAHIFNIRKNQISTIKGRFKDALLYLTHENTPEKHQYERESIVANFDVDAEINKGERKKEITDLIIKLSTGEISFLHFKQNITEEERLLYNNKIETAIKIRSENYKMKKNRNLSVIFINGESGSGKTLFAKYIAEKHGYDYSISSSNNDILQDYNGEECLILDDVRDSSLSFTDMLKLLDNHTNSTIASRYTNKSVAPVKLIIMTSVVPLIDFYKNHDNEPKKQLYRRITEFFNVSPNGFVYREERDFENERVIYHPLDGIDRQKMLDFLSTEKETPNFDFNKLL